MKKYPAVQPSRLPLTYGMILLFSIGVMSGYTQDANPDLLEQEADLLMEQENYQDALPLYSKVVELRGLTDSQVYTTLYKRAVCYFRMEQFEDARLDIERFIDKNPSVPQARLLQTFIYAGLDDVDRQLESLTKLVELDPLNTDMAKWQGSLLLQTGRYDEAREKLKWVRNLKNDQEVELYLGLSYYYDNDPDSAIMQFDKAIEKDKTYLPAYLYAASLCIQEEAFELALDYLDEALSLETGNADALFYKGVALVEMDLKEEGCRYLSRSFYGGNDDASGYLKQYCFQVGF